MASYHLLRLASRIKFLVSTVIQRELMDPRIGLVTVMKVEVTHDMKEATVHVSIFGNPAERTKTIHALEDARGFIQRLVGKNLETRTIPRLKFSLDESEDKVSRIEALIDRLKENREDSMAKKSGKKDEKSGKGSASKPPKPSKSARKPSAAAKKGSEKGFGRKSGSSKAESEKEKDLKTGKSPKADSTEATADSHPRSPKSAEKKKGPRPAGLEGAEEKDYLEDFDAGAEEFVGEEEEAGEDQDMEEEEEEEEYENDDEEFGDEAEEEEAEEEEDY